MSIVEEGEDYRLRVDDNDFESEIVPEEEENTPEEEWEENLEEEESERLHGEEVVEEEEEESVEEEEVPFVSIFEILDAPRELAEPIELTIEHVKQIQAELGIIRLCWPDIIEPEFEGRRDFPSSYTRNTNKEKLLLLYAENFRRQFHCKFPQRTALFLAAANECGLQVSFTTLTCYM